jgi:LacI family transcriptional regulator
MSKKKKVLLAIETSRSYGRGLLSGIFNYSNSHRSWTLMQSPFVYRQRRYYDQNEPETKSPVLSYLQNHDVDGVIMRDEQDLEAVKELNIPVITASYIHQEPGLACIQTNCDGIGVLAAEHFLDRGFRNFGYCGLDKMFWSHLRSDGFQRAVESAGGKFYAYQQPGSKKDQAWTQEQHFLADWLKSLPKPIGIFACNDERARDVIEACMLVGLSIPNDVAVLGVNNDRFTCEMMNEPISSIAINTQKAGYEAAKLLDEMMETKKTAKTKVVVQPTRVVVRHSTDMLAVDNGSVKEAISYIRQHAHEPIQVVDVVGAAAVSRSVLDNLFKQHIGHSIHREIKKFRIKEIKRMLLETDFPVSKIAALLGFTEPNKLSRYFKDQTGTSPIAYRKDHSDNS